MHQIWQAHTDQVRPSCSQEHRETDLVEGQLQLSSRSHQKGVSKSSGFKSPLQPSTATASVPDTSRKTESEMEISMVSDVTHHPASSSPSHQPAIVATSTPQYPALDQFQQMRSMMSTFLGARQDPTPGQRQSFCNYLHSEIEHLEERDFLTFRNETVKLLSEIQYKAKEDKRQVTTSQQATTFQLPEVTQATAGREYILLTIPDTQPVSIPAVQPSLIATTQPASHCQSTATTTSSISVSTTSIFLSCG